MINNRIEGIHFQPWIGAEYESNPNGKILLLGESHYITEEDVEGFSTTSVINNFLAKEKMITHFFTRIALLFKEKYPTDFGDHIAFANLIQNGLAEPASQPEQKDIDTVKPAFKILLDSLTPKKVVVLSKRMWDRWLPTENCKRIQDIIVNKKSADIWECQYQSGSCYAMNINHPTRMFGEQYKEWVPLINEFLAM